MRVHLVSGVFVATEEFRAKSFQESSETLLAEGLQERGIEVSVGGHSLTDSWRTADIVHIHHLANACLRLFLPQHAKIVFTRHATKEIPAHHAFILRRTYQAASAVVNLSQAERVLASKSVPAGKQHVIYNGVASAPFYPAQRSRPTGGEPWVFLYVGQLIELKRVELAIRMIADLTALGIFVRLDIVTHRASLEASLRSLAASLGVASNVFFLGARSRVDLGNEMRRSQFLILPSRTEALPTVVTEAVLTGLPVLSFNVGGVAEQVPSGSLLPNIDCYEEMLGYALALIQRYEEVVSTYFSFVEIAKARFDVNAMVNNHINLYEGLIGE